MGNILSQIAFNRLEDTYLGHYLSSFDVKFIDIGHVINAWRQLSVYSLNTHMIDHMYNSDKNAIFMVDKYRMHSALHRQYLQRQRHGKYEYNEDQDDYAMYNPILL